MNKQLVFVLMVVAIILFSAYQINASGSTGYPWPTDFSPGSIASWAQPLTASGSALPTYTDYYVGEWYVNLATAGSPSLWRRGATSWEMMAGAGSSGGVSSHSLLTQLDYNSAGHTGFVSTSALLLHTASQTDPHGASMTVTEGITVGSGSVDAFAYRSATGTLTIASCAALIPMAATPTGDIATSTLWYDSNLNKLRCFDGTAWQNLF